MLKKITIASIGFVLSGATFAGSMGPVCALGNVTVPCVTRGWDIGVQALYLKPIYDIHRAYQVTGNTIRELDNDFDWGYRLEGSYHFGTGNDLDLNWTHFDATTKFNSFFGPTPIQLEAPFNLKNSTNYDQVNLVFGQHTDVGLLKNIRFFGGLQYVSIHSHIARNFVLPPPVVEMAEITGIKHYSQSGFNGVGPVLGADYVYDFMNGFSISANGAGSIISGSSRHRSGFVFSPSGLVPASTYASKKSMVPSVEAKLGLKYAHQMAQGTLNILGGYQVVNYFHALPTIGVGTSESDFGLYGPYFGINWLGNL